MTALQNNFTKSATFERLRMLTAEEVMLVLNVSMNTLLNYKELGILHPIKTGKSFMYTQDDVLNFQRKYLGEDVSNYQKAYETRNKLETRFE